MTNATKKRDFRNYPSRTATPVVTLRLPADVVEELKALATSENVSVAEIARRFMMQGMGK